MTKKKPQKKQSKGKGKKKQKKVKKPKEPEPEPYWWEKERETENQHYDDEFFIPYMQKIHPTIPDDYSDPLFEKEWKILTTPTDDFPNAGMNNMNIGALFRHYEKKIMPKYGKEWLISMLIPSGNGQMALACGVSMSTMFKPRHRIHTVLGHNIGILRNMLVNMALKNKDATHVFFLDSDVVLPPYSLVRMLQRDVDIVSGIYTMKAPPYVPLAIMRPRNKEGKKKYNFYIDLSKKLLNKFFPIDASGAGCLLIKRHVLEKMGPPWFQVSPQDHGLSAIGEDLFFFDKAIEMGFESYLDTTIQCDHIAGGVAYPQIFFMGKAGIGPNSSRQIDRWNKNAILWAMGLPFYKEPEPPKKETTADVPPTPPTGEPIPLAVEQVEMVGDARSVKK